MVSINFKAVLLLSFFLISCEPESQRNQALLKEISKKKQEIILLDKNFEEVSKEMNEIWLRSLKYRFPDVQEIAQQETPLDLKNLPYLKAVRFQYKTNHLLNFFCIFKTSEKQVLPKFTLFLFADDGTNIHREEITYKGHLFSKYLPVDKQEMQTCKVQVVSQKIPRYFLIRERK